MDAIARQHQASRLTPLPSLISAVTALVAALLLFCAAVAAATDNVVRVVSDEVVVVKEPRAPRGLHARTAIVVDAGTGVKLWGRAANRRGLIASTTKIMTALVAIEMTQPGQLFTASDYRGTLGESLLGLKPGEQMNAQDLIRGLLLESGNDAADTLAKGVSGSSSEFVDQMNLRARQLGLRQTHFANPIGLDSRTNYSTASDLAQLTRTALRVPRFANVVDKPRATLRSGDSVRRIVNRNPLVGRYDWVNGVKTGHTMAAGYLLVASARKNDAEVISVVTGEPTEAAREHDSEALLRFGRAHFASVDALDRARPLAALDVDYQDVKAAVVPAETLKIAASDGQRVIVQVDAPRSIRGPRAKGETVGRAVVMRDGKQLASVPVLLSQAVPEAPITAVILHTVASVLPYLLLLVAIGLIAAYFLRGKRTRRHSPRELG